MEEDRLKDQSLRLEVAINKALRESTRIKSIIRGIREVGYDVVVEIEATLKFEPLAETEPARRVRLELTTQDQRFLRSLKISPE